MTKFEYTNLFERGAYGRLLAALRLRAENLDRILPHSLKKRTSLPEKMCILEIADSFWQNWPQVPEPVRTELAKFIESLVMDPITLDILSFGKSKSKISAKKLLLLRNLSRSVEGMKNTYVYRLNYREESITCTGNCV